MNPKILLLLLLSAALPIQAKAQPTTTLSQAIHDAWGNRKNIQAGRLNSDVQALQTAALHKKYYPQVSLDYSYQYNPILQSSILPIGKFNPEFPADATERVQFGTTWSQAAGATVLQPLMDFSIKRQIAESHLQEKISGATQAQAEYELAYQVTKAYINIAVQQQQIRSATLDSARTWVSFRLQQDIFDAGRLLKSDLNKAIINHNNEKQKVADAIAQVVQNKIYLLFLTGKTFTDGNDLAIDSNFFKQDMALWLGKPSEKDSIPAIEQLRLQQAFALLQQRSEKSKYLPTLHFKGFIGANQFTNNFNPVEADTWFGYSYLALVAKLPILTGDDKKKKIQQLQLQSTQYELQRADRSEQSEQEFVTAKLEIERLQHQLRTLSENLLLSRESVRIIQDRALAGQETAAALNTEELELQRIASDVTDIQQQIWLFWLEYLKASGLLQQLWQ